MHRLVIACLVSYTVAGHWGKALQDTSRLSVMVLRAATERREAWQAGFITFRAGLQGRDQASHAPTGTASQR